MRQTSSSAARGRAARKRAPLDSHAHWVSSAAGRDPVTLLEEHARGLGPDLMPLRFGRMLRSACDFFGGAGAVMAADLATTADSGLLAQLCGDAQIDNFAWFMRPDGTLVFDIDHFDETASGPWEWDVKRLVTSLEVAARERGLGERQRRRLVRAAADAYCDAIRRFAAHEYMVLTYPETDEDSARRLATASKGLRRPARLTAHAGKGFRLVNSPPAIERLGDALDREDGVAALTAVESDLRAYRAGLRDDHQHILDRFVLTDAARKVEDMYDMATPTMLVLLVSHDRGEPLILELKEATSAVLAIPSRGGARTRNDGRRVVEGRRLIEASTDVLIGWFTGRGWYGVTHDYHVRQSWPRMVVSSAGIDVHALLPTARAAARTLARAHARSGDRVAIATYIGRGEAFPAALGEFAAAYADQNERDHEALTAAAVRGRIVARAV